ncbi:MAG: hypothetical protein QM709_15915 [Spongiibacteraceae bacterium]
MQLKSLKASLLATALCAPLLAHAEFGIYAKAGTFGFGGGIGYGVTENLTARLGYTAFNYDTDVDTDDVNYDAEAKIGGGELMLDWHPFSGSFRLTAGMIANRNKIDVEAKANQSVTINGTTYTSSQLGTLDGTVDFKSTAPYLGIGWGNVAGKNGNFHFVADIGVVFQGSPDVKLNGTCGASLSAPQCSQLQSNVQAEEDDLNDEVSDYKHWPVISFGLGYRF